MHKKYLLYCWALLCLAGCARQENSLLTDPPSQGVFIALQNGKYQLYRNGMPFHIRGVAGQPYIRELKAAGGNCLRVYDTLQLGRILDSAHHYGIAVIADLPLPKSRYLDSYKDEEEVNARFLSYRNIVRRYRNHPALLMWMLGNELDFPYKPNYAPFYRAYNDLLTMIKREDGQHPVATALTNFERRPISNIRLKVPGLDLIGINTFGLLPSLQRDISDFSWMWDGPYFVSEWAGNGYWEMPRTAWQVPLENTSWKKAQQLRERYRRAMPDADPRFLGSLLFYWGHKHETTETWFNVFTRSGRPTDLYCAFAGLWRDSLPVKTGPVAEYVLIEGKGGQDNIILSAGGVYRASVPAQVRPGKPLQTRWEIWPEDWFLQELDTAITLQPKPGLLLHQDSTSLLFRAPLNEGPYRLFAWLAHPETSVSAANIPFYVVE